MTTLRFSLAIVFALGALSGFARAELFMDVEDGSILLADAQVTDVTPLTLIQGTLGFSNDIDIFKIFIDDPANFSATVRKKEDDDFRVLDSQLFLFSEDGLGVVANDDTIDALDFNATIPVGHVTEAGLYYLTIAEFADKPISSGGEKIFPDFFTDPPVAFDAVVGATGPGGPGPIVGWEFVDSSLLEFGDFYEIELTGARGVIPEPSTLASFSVLLSLAALRFYSRRRRS